MGLTNKIIVLLIVATILMVVVDGLLVCELDALQENNKKITSQLKELQIGIIEDYIEENTNKLNITELIVYNLWVPVPAIYAATVNVTIHNQGINDVNNLTLTIETADETYNITIEGIHAGQKTIFTKKVAWFDESEKMIIAKIYAWRFGSC